jgi:hypothetical protein
MACPLGAGDASGSRVDRGTVPRVLNAISFVERQRALGSWRGALLSIPLSIDPDIIRHREG